MKNWCPDTRPDHDLWIERNVVDLDNVVDRIVKERNETGDTNDGDRLCGQSTEHKRCESRAEQPFIHTVKTAGSPVHIEDECQSREETIEQINLMLCVWSLEHSLHKVYSYGACNGPVICTVFDVTPVVWKSSSNVVKYSQARSKYAITLPPRYIIERIRFDAMHTALSGIDNKGLIRHDVRRMTAREES